VAHRTVRCARPGHTLVVFCSLCLNPFLVFLLVCCEPLAPVKLIIYSKLVSPIICVGQFNHQNQLGKGVSLFPFQDVYHHDFYCSHYNSRRRDKQRGQDDPSSYSPMQDDGSGYAGAFAHTLARWGDGSDQEKICAHLKRRYWATSSIRCFALRIIVTSESTCWSLAPLYVLHLAYKSEDTCVPKGEDTLTQTLRGSSLGLRTSSYKLSQTLINTTHNGVRYCAPSARTTLNFMYTHVHPSKQTKLKAPSSSHLSIMTNAFSYPTRFLCFVSAIFLFYTTYCGQTYSMCRYPESGVPSSTARRRRTRATPPGHTENGTRPHRMGRSKGTT
jgi:hypothetical protein